MDNKARSKVLSLVITSVIILLTLLGIWVLFKTIVLPSRQNNVKAKKVEVNVEAYEKITSPQTYGSEISIEEGYGRTNPFTPYK